MRLAGKAIRIRVNGLKEVFDLSPCLALERCAG
jgi:hypothetical protein